MPFYHTVRPRFIKLFWGVKLSPLQVAFIGEKGVDARGLSAEFFSLLSKSLLKWEKKVLEVHESSLVWFNPDVSSPNIPHSSWFLPFISMCCDACVFSEHARWFLLSWRYLWNGALQQSLYKHWLSTGLVQETPPAESHSQWSGGTISCGGQVND